MALTALEFVNALRAEEMRAILERHLALFANRDLLELGSGAGAQLLKLREICRSAEGLDTERRPDALTSVLTYDGKTFPFRDASFDVIFSSNVLEHIADEAAVYSEMHRVLRPGGICVHVV